ncbi:alkaline shock response membrane anchor protein AmaP [Acidimicrobiia bacterium EGI L10123]|uniref:hypothetical protein n=1 Tax=Salinilacustrithrix flava TaxID=2957203 RepID=UPI003D7C1DCF|nr:alkaline shock response membrane anchor protein AmaP [Acidimicrobiia bacterium EGI L10123]
MIDGFNRFLLLLLGLVLAGAGALGLAAGEGAFDDLDSPATLYDDARAEVVADPDLWYAVVLGVSGLVLAFALLWLFKQFASRPGGPHLSTVTVAADRRGRTTLEPVAVAQAMENDLETVDGVRSARVRIRSMGQEPAMRVRLTVDRAADPDRVLGDAEHALQRGAQSLSASDVAARIRIDFAGRDESRVV